MPPRISDKGSKRNRPRRHRKTGAGRQNQPPPSSLKPLLPRRAFYLHTMPGLEKIAWREVKMRFPKAGFLGSYTIGPQNGLLAFGYNGPPADLLTLRTAEDVFTHLASLNRLPKGRGALSSLPQMMDEQVIWPAVLKIHREATGYVPRAGWQTTYRVISRVLGGRPFHRKEAQHRLEKAIRTANPRWVLVEDDSLLEIWFNILESHQVITGLRLSDRSMRHRHQSADVAEHTPAALRASVAATMVLLSNPQNDDVFLDPMCGSGTILMERGEWGRYQQLLGGDANREALTTARYNIGSKYQPITLSEWDATNLNTLASASVDKVVCNLPFGHQIGTPQSNQALYSQFLAEMRRVVARGGRLVLLTGDAPLLRENLARFEAFHLNEEISMTLLGRSARIFVITKQ